MSDWLDGGGNGGWLDQPVEKGKQHTSSWGSPSPSVRPEPNVRPFESYQERRDQRLAQLRAAPGEEHEAELCFGEEVQYQDSTTNPPDGGGFKTQPPKEDPREPSDPEYVWNEEKRQTKTIRVENPDDEDQYVMVERIEKLLMRAPTPPPFGGKMHVFNFKNK